MAKGVHAELRGSTVPPMEGGKCTPRRSPKTDFVTADAVHKSWLLLNPNASADLRVAWTSLPRTKQRKDVHFATQVRSWLLENMALVPEAWWHSKGRYVKSCRLSLGRWLFANVDYLLGLLSYLRADDDKLPLPLLFSPPPAYSSSSLISIPSLS